MDIFETVFDNSMFVQFNQMWRTPTGDFKPLVSNMEYMLPAGEVIASRDPGNRRLLIKGTNAGNVVISEKNNQGPRILLGTYPFMFKVKVINKPHFPLNMEGPLNVNDLEYLLNLW